MATMRPKKNPITKVITKIAKEVTKKGTKKAKPLAQPKSTVRVKPAAKQKPNKPDARKIVYKDNSTRVRAYVKAVKDYEKETGKYGNPYEMQSEASAASIYAKLNRKGKIQTKKIAESVDRKATTPRPSKDVVNSNPWERPVRINTNPLKTTGFSNLKRKVSSMDTPANRAKAKANARGLKAANKGKTSSKNIPVKTLGGRTVNQELARLEKLSKSRTK